MSETGFTLPRPAQLRRFGMVLYPAGLRMQQALLQHCHGTQVAPEEQHAVVTAQARDTDGKQIQWCFARFSNLAEFPNIKDEIVAQLDALFPECDIKYILPEDDYEGQASHVISVNWDEVRNEPEPEPAPALVPGPVYPPMPTENGFN